MREFTRWMAAWVVPWCSLAAMAADDARTARMGECHLQGGGVIEDCTLAYRDLGDPQGRVLVFPTWYTGTTEHLVQFGYIGKGRMADTARYRVIAIDAFGNGQSSSPSNSAAQGGERFPQFNIADMVEAQHRLLTEVLGLETVYAVVGVSMGGMQAFEWLLRHPGFMERVVAIEGTPWPTAHDLLLWGAWLDASQVYDGNEPSLALASRLLAQLDALTLWTPQHFNAMVAPEALPEFLAGFIPQLGEGAMLDRRYQTLAALAHDVRANGDPALRARARLLNVVFRQDLMVNPAPAQDLTGAVGGQSLVLDTACGHMGPATECEQARVAEAVNAFLSEP